MIEITVNGEPQTTPEGQTIQGLIRQLELDPARVAVELEHSWKSFSLWVEDRKQPLPHGRGSDRRVATPVRAATVRERLCFLREAADGARLVFVNIENGVELRDL